MNVRRDPSGKFIGRGDALTSWVPSFLDWAYGDALASLLAAAAKWCEKRAQACYRRAADVFDGDFWLDPPARAQSFAANAETWFKRRSVLLEAKKQIEEIS